MTPCFGELVQADPAHKRAALEWAASEVGNELDYAARNLVSGVPW